MTSWDLVGDLGASEGPPIVYNWMAQGLVAPLLPWMAILVLLALKPNRGWPAWWIWLPMSCLAAGWHLVEVGISGLPKDVLNVLLDVPRALAFGIAALWLLAPSVAGGGQLGRFVRLVCVVAAFGVFSFVIGGGWDQGAAARMRGLPGGGYPFAAAWAGGTPQVLLLIVMGLVIAAAVVLSGLLCSSRSLPRLCLHFAVLLPAVLLAAAVLAYLLMLVRPPSAADPLTFLAVGLLISVLSLANLLPFVVLSAAKRLFRERFKCLFHSRFQEQAPGFASLQNPPLVGHY